VLGGFRFLATATNGPLVHSILHVFGTFAAAKNVMKTKKKVTM
jgi:hypothetical protein